MEYVILLVATLAIIVIVVFIRKRTDFFVISTLSCYLVSSIIVVIYSLYNHISKPESPITWLEYVQQFGRFCYMMGHWAFSAQYLKTKMVLPRILNQAKLDHTRANENKISNRRSATGLVMTRSSLDLLEEVDDAIV